MAKFRFHKLAAVAVLVGFAAWMGTGKFSSVGSASAEGEAAPAEQAMPEQPKAAPRTVAVITPPRIQHARAIRLSGQTEADKRAVLATRAAGIIEELPVKQGDHVKAGDLILLLGAEDKPAMVEMAKQIVKQRQAELEAAERLARTGNLPKLQLDTAVSALAQAKSQLEQAQAELDRNRIVAPFTGIVDKVSVEMGSSVMQGGEVATLLSLDPVLVKGEISERDLRHVAIGDTAEAVLVDGETVKGTVRYISREASPTTRTFRIEVAIPNPDNRIPAGMTSEITVRAASTDAVVLPRSVVTLNANGDLGIRAVDRESKIVFYPIDLVDDTARGFVLGGIPADAQIVVAGQDLVAEGDVVNAVPADRAVLDKLAGNFTGTN
ncbi:MAG: efflux RND transporter periplasmic adaptor subunit [Hyphomicrobiales bacterium]|nr:efflux RND transporter periplasmic adaptor subunit [Hyphomicrobiales bacterium]